MNIFFAINDNYVTPLAVALTSILENTNKDLHFFILQKNLSDASKSKISNLIKCYFNANVEYIDIDSKLFANFESKIDYISQESYFRYLIPQLKPNLDKALYLDADLVVIKDISELYETKIEDNYCAGVRDLFINKYKEKIGLSLTDLYINSGVMLLNCKKIREDNMVDELLKNNHKYKEVAYFQDQDIINITFKGKIKEIDSIYNFATFDIKNNFEKSKDAVIVHFTGEFKPWLPNCWNKLKHLWDYYLDVYNKKTIDK